MGKAAAGSQAAGPTVAPGAGPSAGGAAALLPGRAPFEGGRVHRGMPDGAALGPGRRGGPPAGGDGPGGARGGRIGPVSPAA